MRIPKELFTPDVRFFDSASYGLLPHPATLAMHRQIDLFSHGQVDIKEFDAIVVSALGHLATAYGCSSDHFGAIGQLATASSMVAHSIPFGSKVLMAKEDFTSVLFPFLERQAQSEIVVDFVPANQLVDKINENYTLIAVSAVQSATGFVIDLDRLSEKASRLGVKTFIDATQAAGWLPMRLDDFDVVAASAYKWLLCPRGTGFIHTTEEARHWLRPTMSSWYASDAIWDSIYGPPLRLANDGRRYQISPDWLSWVGAEHSLKLISEIGVHNVYNHNVELMKHLCKKSSVKFNDSSIVSVESNLEPNDLIRNGFRASLRNGRLRISIHLYNTQDDVEKLASLLNSKK